jgi:hypothetical protein
MVFLSLAAVVVATALDKEGQLPKHCHRGQEETAVQEQLVVPAVMGLELDINLIDYSDRISLSYFLEVLVVVVV